MDDQKKLTDQLTKILDRIKQNKTYGSLEIFFEEGNVTQITQRIINKFHSKPKKASNPPVSKSSHPPVLKNDIDALTT